MADPKFDFTAGKGTPLGKLPCFTTVKRGKATKELENAIEPLHRLVYGRPGQSGERKANLESFQGFPVSMEEEVKEKLSHLTKDKLRTMIGALGMRVLTSQNHPQVVEGVLAFLMKPKDEGKIKVEKAKEASETKKRARSPQGSGGRGRAAALDGAEDAEDEVEKEEQRMPEAKKTRTEAAKPAKTATAAPTAVTATGPTDDAVRVHVYRRVLTMTPEERAALGVRQLRTELEVFFRVGDGALKRCKDLIAETASDCVGALLAAEERARRSVEREAPQPLTATLPTGPGAHASAAPATKLPASNEPVRPTASAVSLTPETGEPSL